MIAANIDCNNHYEYTVGPVPDDVPPTTLKTPCPRAREILLNLSYRAARQVA